MIDDAKKTVDLGEQPGKDDAALTAGDSSRREAMRRIGRFSAYAAPALVAMLSGKAAHAS